MNQITERVNENKNKVPERFACLMFRKTKRGDTEVCSNEGFIPQAAKQAQKAMAPHSVLCLENRVDGGAWSAAVHGAARSRTRLSHFPFTFHFRALEKEMAAHSSVLACRIPGTGSLCRLWGCTESDTTEVT